MVPFFVLVVGLFITSVRDRLSCKLLLSALNSLIVFVNNSNSFLSTRFS